MTISYPLAFPTHTRVRGISMRAVNAVAHGWSPFTFQGQVQAFAGQMWQAEVSLPPMKRAQAEAWLAWLVSLRGPYGTFLMGDPLGCTPRGQAATHLGTPIITAQTGGSVAVTGASASRAGWLLAGDYVQLGSGATATLHKVLADANTNASGETTLELWPHLRASRSGAVVVSNTAGRWRLTGTEHGWSSSELAVYGVTFGCMEAI